MHIKTVGQKDEPTSGIDQSPFDDNPYNDEYKKVPIKELEYTMYSLEEFINQNDLDEIGRKGVLNCIEENGNISLYKEDYKINFHLCMIENNIDLKELLNDIKLYNISSPKIFNELYKDTFYIIQNYIFFYKDYEMLDDIKTTNNKIKQKFYLNLYAFFK